MFDFKQWLKQSYINLVLNGTWSRDYCAAMCAGQLDRGRFSDGDVEDIYYMTEPKTDAEPEQEVDTEPEETPEVEPEPESETTPEPETESNPE